jgi:hypothetical protein
LPGNYRRGRRSRYSSSARGRNKHYRLLKKAVPATRHGGAWGERRYSSYSFLTSATVWGRVVSVKPRPRFTPGERTPGNHWIRGLVGHRVGLDAEASRKIICLCRGSNPDRPARSQTLYCLSYRGSQTVNVNSNLNVATATDCDGAVRSEHMRPNAGLLLTCEHFQLHQQAIARSAKPSTSNTGMKLWVHVHKIAKFGPTVSCSKYNSRTEETTRKT